MGTANDGGQEVLTLDHDFVKRWCDKYDEIFRVSYDETEEKAIRTWLNKQSEPKYLNKEYFVRLGRWKTKRQTSNYEANDQNTIIEVTRSAYQASDPLIKLSILGTLRGVGVAVAGTILHYLHPEKFPIFDYHARTTLKKANLWDRDVKDDSEQAWLEYTDTMNELAKGLDVSLRDLDKALFAYDKYSPGRITHRTHTGTQR
jgi:thermostable 8-oxoguanine DNA glycosylase